MSTTTATTTTTTTASQLSLTTESPHTNERNVVLNYMKPGLNEKPFRRLEPGAGQLVGNVETASYEAKIKDVRGQEKNYTIDSHGFQFVKNAISDENRENLRARRDNEILEKYYPEVEKLLKEKLGADRVFIFDHTIRKNNNSTDTNPSKAVSRVPAAFVHVDQTPKAGFNRVRHHLPDQADELLKGRVQIINVWRPLIEPLEDHPLAVADYFSLAPGDLVATDLIYPDRTGETYSVLHNPNHKWHFLSNQKTDEVILIKCFDSKEEGVARLTPHTAFKDPTARDDAPPRESVEVRCLVFYSPENNNA